MIRHRVLTTIALATLLAAPLAACTSNAGEEGPTTTTTQEAPPTADPADATAQERLESYFEASDAAAAEGWEDSSYADEYLVPELAEKQQEIDAERAAEGTVITGERVLSDWTVVEETDTTATIEFCDDTTAWEATQEGEPVEITNKGVLVGKFKLVRDSETEPWLIETKAYYDEETTCDAHFTA